ncbi:MAG: hypothetical protein JSW14_04495 [Candidatus Bathyarchaeum sp.]|nr:MAG: hypothetical protein JSW14_04495 [Candidatus Bathyarchaeum sp.]
MKIAIRMLGIATIILWIITIFFIVTSVYSVLQLGITIGGVQMFPSSEGINFSLPFSISNNGYYEIADLNLTTRVTDPDGTILDRSETIIPSIPQATTINSTHTVPIDLDTILSMDHVPLLLNDSSFDIEIFAALNFARAIPIQVYTNATIPWGAPLSHFSVGRPSVSPFNSTHSEATTPVSFQNNAVLDLVGTLKMEFYSDSQGLIASGETPINVPSGKSYNGEVNAYPRQQDVSKLRDRENVHVIFETPMFVVEWEESYG